MNWLKAQFRALGASDLPLTVTLEGKPYLLEKVFKHNWPTAVGLYRHGEDLVVCKFHRRASFFGLPVGWLGRVMAAYEAAVMRQVQDLSGVPRLRGMVGETGLAREFVLGKPLRKRMRVDDSFFPQLFELLGGIHGRGIAYVDLEKPENVLLGDDGRPYLIDFQIAFYWPRRYLGETALARFLRRELQRSDLYHAMKHLRKMRPDLLTPEQMKKSRERPLVVRIGNILMAPYMALRKLVVRK